MPTEIGEVYTEEILEAFRGPYEDEEIPYEEHIERMERYRDERRDRVYPAPRRDPIISHPNEDRITSTDFGVSHFAALHEEPIVTKFKIGDEVLLDPSKIPLGAIRENSSSGQVGSKYIIKHVDNSPPYTSYHLEGSNWHREEWLTLVPKKNLIGGQLL